MVTGAIVIKTALKAVQQEEEGFSTSCTLSQVCNFIVKSGQLKRGVAKNRCLLFEVLFTI